MRAEKSNFTVYSSLPKVDSSSRPINIWDLIQKNKKDEKREKTLKIYTLLFGFVGLVLVLGVFIYL